MKVMVTGARGMLGQEVLQALHRRGVDCIPADVEDFDLRSAEEVDRFVGRCQPDAIIHCAAYTAVDRAESEPDACMAVNSMGTLHLVRAALKTGATLMYVSTDYVFPGEGDEPYAVNGRTRPLNIYGLSKLQGEEAVRGLMTKYFIVRTSWLFGAGGPNFVRTMLRLGRERSVVRVVDDQIGSPTYAADLASAMASLILTSRYGVYHITGEGYCSFAHLADAALRASGSRCHVEPIPTSEYPSAARRPLNSRLDKRCLDAAGFPRLPIWEDALARYLAEMRARGEL